jgi:transcriptional antiterminator Rof (Rho-off)
MRDGIKNLGTRRIYRIHLEGGYRVYLFQGDKNSLTARASDKEVFDYLRVRNEGESLKLKIDREHFNFDRISLYITFRDLEKVHIEGGVRLKTKGYLDLNDLMVKVEGGAKIEMNVKAKNIAVVSEGGVLFELDGIADRLDVKVSGAGHINAGKLKTKEVNFKVEGVGTGSVYATETLAARIEGVGKIKYRGNPQVTKSIDGVGSITSE